VLRHVVKALCHLLLYSLGYKCFSFFLVGYKRRDPGPRVQFHFLLSKIAVGMYGQWGPARAQEKKTTRSAREIFALAEREIN
jgi:hypothetical protein